MLSDLIRLESQFVGKAAALLPFFEDDSVSDILIQGIDSAYVERNGRLESIPNPFTDRTSLDLLIERLMVSTGRRLDARSPFSDGVLGDGSRFHLVVPPASPSGPCVSIRKLKRRQPLTLLHFGEADLTRFLISELEAKKNMLISGGTGAGKTTLLGLLISAVAPETRWLLVEETPEILTDVPHVVRLEAKPANAEGAGEITLRQLVRQTLRMRPDRIVVGECRGGEAFDMLQAMATGHSGSLGTLHASSAREALSRFECLVGLGEAGLPFEAIRRWIGQAVDWVVHVEREATARRITQVLKVEGTEGDKYRISPVFPLEIGAGARNPWPGIVA